MYRPLNQCRRPEDYVRQDFTQVFQAPGMWDRPSGKRLILSAREVLTELVAVSRRRRELVKQLRELSRLIESTINNDDPQRSP